MPIIRAKFAKYLPKSMRLLTEREAWLEILERRGRGAGKAGLCGDIHALTEERRISCVQRADMRTRLYNLLEPEDYGLYFWRPHPRPRADLVSNTVRMTAVCFILATFDEGF